MSSPHAGPFEAIRDLVQVFEEHGVRYLIGGLIASSLFGRFRTTNDIDCLVDIPRSALDDVVAAFRKGFVIDEAALKKHLQLKKTYNIIHDASFIKVDLFCAANEFHDAELARAVVISPEGANVRFRVASAEDMILSKLLWWKSTNYTSERHQRDLEGIVAVARSQLDLNYLRSWGEKLEVFKELEELLSSA